MINTDFVTSLLPDRGELIVVDRDRTNLGAMGRRLTRLGFSVALVDNSAAALDIVQARRFDLMLLDMAMPLLSGVGVLREIRSAAATCDLPVLMITSRSDPGAAIEALAAGADDHIVKPFDFDMLAARIDRQLARARAFERLRRSNAALDARIANRAVELGELRATLEEVQAQQAAALHRGQLTETSARG